MPAMVSRARKQARSKAKSSKRNMGKLGSGKRAAALKRKGLSGALIGWIGRKRYGSKKMAKWSAAGRKRNAKKKG